MEHLTPIDVASRLRTLLEISGLAELVGGPAVLEQGLADLARGLDLVATELLAAEAAGVPLSQAVLDSEMCPHTSRLHGLLGDLLKMDVPTELLPWARRLVESGPAPDAPEVRRALTFWAVRAPGPKLRMLAQLALFEAVVFNQRLLLLVSGVRLDVVPGQGRTVEEIADLEVLRVSAIPEYASDLLDLEDPLPVLVAKAFEQLGLHVDELRDELAWATAPVRQAVETRRELLEILDRLPPEDAVLLFNEGGLGPEVLTVEDLRHVHPGLLGGRSRDALYQRARRARAKARRVAAEAVDLRVGVTFADLLLADIRGVQS